MLGSETNFKEGELYHVTPTPDANNVDGYIYHVTSNISADSVYNKDYRSGYGGVIYGTDDGRHPVSEWDYEFLSLEIDFKDNYPEYFL